MTRLSYIVNHTKKEIRCLAFDDVFPYKNTCIGSIYNTLNAINVVLSTFNSDGWVDLDSIDTISDKLFNSEEYTNKGYVLL